MITKTDTLLFKMLGDKGLVSAEALKIIAEEASKSKDSSFALLLKGGAVCEEDLLKNLSELMKLPFVEMSALKPDPVVIEKVPLKIAEYYKIMPLKIEKRKLQIAVPLPLDLRTQDDIRAHLGYEIEMVLAREKDIAESIKKYYGFAAGTIGEMIASTPPADSTTALSDQVYENIENILNVEKMAGDASIAKLVNQIILEAYRKRATDIHIEPFRGKVKLRYRIDGILYNANVQSEMARFILPILSRVKIMSNLNIVEKRLPQDGRAIVKIEDATLDLRVSSIPTPYGESVVIRLLPMNRIFNLSQLGLSPEQLKIFENLVDKPHGVVFITGPTGSGKSTTLYACLNKINTDARKIITIEDPVEYEMEGVTQIQVVSNIGLDFARGLRSILRHDPDVIMVGEVRDLETAEIAIRVALTGHLVLSTLHTNDSASSITRLVDIGVEPYLVASSVEAFIAQRLVRVICPHCKEEDKSPTSQEMKKIITDELKLKKDMPLILSHGRGCDQCNATGFWGRIAIYEILLMNEKIKEMIMRRAPSGEIKRLAIEQGMRTLRQDGWQKVMMGLTTPEEILKVAQIEKEAKDELTLPTEDPSPVIAPSKKEALSELARYSDRRLFMRLNENINIRYRVVKIKDVIKKASAMEELTVTKNISAGGLLFIARESIPISSILELSIELPSEHRPVECLARVVREEEVEIEQMFDIAVCFLDLSGSDRARLEKFVQKERG